MQPIESLDDFTNRIQEHVGRLTKSGKAEHLPTGGENLVVMSQAAYEQLADLADLAESLQAIRNGLDELERGEGRPAHEAIEAIRRRHAANAR